MLTNTLVTAAASAQPAMPAWSMTVRYGAPKTRSDCTAMSAVRSCASTFGSASAAVIGNNVPGSPPWSSPV